MAIIDEIRSKRQKLSEVLEEHPGIRKTVEDLYPDRAHFIYELLQNAEDTRATSVSFILFKDRLIFEHNGTRGFNQRDVEAITNIGEGTKVNEVDKIGRFGIGFKAVFAYTESPKIWSSDLSFEIKRFILPFELPPSDEVNLCKITRFEFPFNSVKKNQTDAYSEVLNGLKGITEKTLLFLSNIESIKWRENVGMRGDVIRVEHPNSIIEILREVDGLVIANSHYIRLSEPAVCLPSQSISIAYELEIIDKKDTVDGPSFRIIPSKHGTVSVFFPAEKETSGLRFHIHAPFVPELSRASIKNVPANVPLIAQIGELAAKTLHVLRDASLLNVHALGALPNDRDDISEFYAVIRSAVLEAMNAEPLTPTADRRHSPARMLVRGGAAIKSSITDVDLPSVLGKQAGVCWAASAPQRNSDADRLLSCLDMITLDGDELINHMTYWSNSYRQDIGIKDGLKWLSSKDSIWFCSLYKYLNKHISDSAWNIVRQHKEAIKGLYLIRTKSNGLEKGPFCFFPSSLIDDDERFLVVDSAIYATRVIDKPELVEDAKAKEFLDWCGVRAVGNEDLIKDWLRNRYLKGSAEPSWDEHVTDVIRLCRAFQGDKSIAKLLSDRYILLGSNGEWFTPGSMFIDGPFEDTGLMKYYAAIPVNDRLFMPMKKYLDDTFGIPQSAFIDMIVAAGVVRRISIKENYCWRNPNRDKLRMNSGKSTHLGVNKDYIINGIPEILCKKEVELSRAIWNCLCRDATKDWHLAKYSNNGSESIREVPSLLCISLEDNEWVPQGGGSFVRPSEARRDLLPDGFLFDSGWPWIKALRFGESLPEHVRQSVDDERKARELGLASIESLEFAKEIDNLDQEGKDAFRQFIASRKRTNTVDSQEQAGNISSLPDVEVPNPDLRFERVEQDSREAPGREVEARERLVSVNRGRVKAETHPYLIENYTKDGVTICQICRRDLPFRVNGMYYFECVELVTGLKRFYRQNYLCLCPNHAAMYKHVNSDKESMRSLLMSMDGQSISITLADKTNTVYFTKKHSLDIKAVLEADRKMEI